MISDKTTAGELLDILFRFSGLPSNSYFDVKDNGRQIENSDISIELYELHVVSNINMQTLRIYFIASNHF